jgi:hypothetical protein
MRASLQIRTSTRVFFACWFAVLTLMAVPAGSQQTPARVTTVVDDAVRTTIAGTRPPLAKIENDTGRVPLGTLLQGIQITFRRTPAQEAELQAMISSQWWTSLWMFEKPLKSQPHISLKSRNGIDDLFAFDIHLFAEQA